MTDEGMRKTIQLLDRLDVVTGKDFKDTNARINALVDSQMRTQEEVRKTTGRVRNLMAVVDRHFS